MSEIYTFFSLQTSHVPMSRLWEGFLAVQNISSTSPSPRLPCCRPPLQALVSLSFVPPPPPHTFGDPWTFIACYQWPSRRFMHRGREWHAHQIPFKGKAILLVLPRALQGCCRLYCCTDFGTSFSHSTALLLINSGSFSFLVPSTSFLIGRTKATYSSRLSYTGTIHSYLRHY